MTLSTLEFIVNIHENLLQFNCKESVSGTSVYYRYNDILAVKWDDEDAILIFSTFNELLFGRNYISSPKEIMEPYYYSTEESKRFQLSTAHEHVISSIDITRMIDDIFQYFYARC